MVHQHFMLIPVMTVAENIVLGDRADDETASCSTTARRDARVAELAERSGSRSTRTRSIQDITVGQQQRVEILKALYRSADILILDEPTAVLTPQEAERALRDPPAASRREGMSIIFISHKLNEVLEIADRVTRAAPRQDDRDAADRRGRRRRSSRGAWSAATSLLRVEKGASHPGDADPRCRGPARPGRPRHREGARRLVRGPRRRDRRRSPASTATARRS